MHPFPLAAWAVTVATCLVVGSDRTGEFRDRFAIADTLEVRAATVDDGSAAGKPVATEMTCRLARAGTAKFHFEPATDDGRPEDVTVAFPPPPPSHLPRANGIHGAPPRAGDGSRGPVVSRDAAHPDVVTVRWASGAAAGRYAVTLDSVTFADPPADK